MQERDAAVTAFETAEKSAKDAASAADGECATRLSLIAGTLGQLGDGAREVTDSRASRARVDSDARLLGGFFSELDDACL